MPGENVSNKAFSSGSRVSVVIVSRGRPQHLRRCLTGVGQLCHPDFEIVVVADPAGCEVVVGMGWEERVKLLGFDEANISAARNVGIAAAAGDVVAFIDDDAVPEPTWLTHLTAPFADPGVIATGGYVIGRSGIRFQWRGNLVTRTGVKIAIAHDGTAPFTPKPAPGLGVMTEGTNAAFRRETLAAIGGFDPLFRFHLDETELNMRLASVPGDVVLVPLAQVHHGTAASVRRKSDRAPTDLTEIGASTAVYLRKHAPDSEHRAALDALIAERRTSLLRFMVGGRLEPRDVRRVLATLKDGIAEGMTRKIVPLAPMPEPSTPFLPFTAPLSGRSRYLAGRAWQRRALARKADELVRGGDIVTVFRFGPTPRAHTVRFSDKGWWEQTGGLFGRSERIGPRLRFARHADRVESEWARVAKLRQCDRNTP